MCRKITNKFAKRKKYTNISWQYPHNIAFIINLPHYCEATTTRFVGVVFLCYLCGMKLRRIIILAAVAVFLCAATSCVSQNYIMFEDDEWSGAEMDGDRSLVNSELEMDDWDR